MEPPLTVAIGKTVTLGDNVYVNCNLTLVDDYTIRIGNGVLIAPNVVIITTGHPVHHKLREHGEMYSFEVNIGDNVWIGSNVVICPGVTIGENSIIGAGSIVLHDVAGQLCGRRKSLPGNPRDYRQRSGILFQRSARRRSTGTVTPGACLKHLSWYSVRQITGPIAQNAFLVCGSKILSVARYAEYF